MGKKRKSSSSANKDLNTVKKVKNKKIKFDDSSDTEGVRSEPVLLNTAKTKTAKRKTNKTLANKDVPENAVVACKNNAASESKFETVQTCTSPANKKTKAQKSNQEESENNKKIIFSNAEPVVVNNPINNRRKPKNTDLSQEDDVKDEDIDKFCEEIDDEDNLQYENWVKLIEAKLSSNKKKTK